MKIWRGASISRSISCSVFITKCQSSINMAQGAPTATGTATEVTTVASLTVVPCSTLEKARIISLITLLDADLAFVEEVFNNLTEELFGKS